MSELGTAYVQVIPSATGIKGELTNLIVPEADSAGKEGGEAAGNSLASSMKKIIAAAGIGLAIKKSIDAVGDLAAYGDNIDKMSQKLGISAQAYQEWDAVLQHSGSSIEAMKPVFKTLINQAEAGSDAFTELGISQEQLASMSQEEIFSATITALQNMEEGSERTALATKLLGRGAQELGPLLNTSAEDTEAMRQAVHDLGGVMSDEAVKDAAAYQDALQDMQTALSGLSRGLLSQFLPGFTSVMNGVSAIFSGDPSGGVGMIITGITSIGSTIFESIPQIVGNVGELIGAVMQEIVNRLPEMIQSGMDMVSGWAEGMLTQAPDVITSSGDIITQAIGFLLENLPLWWEKGVEFISSLAQGVMSNMPEILTSIGSVLGQVIITIIQDFPNFMKRGFELVGKVASGLIQAIPTIVAAVPQVLGKISEWVSEQDWLGMGINLITTIGEGIRNMGTEIWKAMKQVGEDAIEKFKNIDWNDLGHHIIDGIVAGLAATGDAVTTWLKNMAKGALNKVKSFLGIASPSKVFRDQVGKWIPLGIAEGIEAGSDALHDAMGDMSDIATGEAKEMIYRANNTYMPGNISNDKVLSRLDAMINLMAEYYPEMAESADGKALISGMNRALGMAVV